MKKGTPEGTFLRCGCCSLLSLPDWPTYGLHARRQNPARQQLVPGAAINFSRHFRRPECENAHSAAIDAAAEKKAVRWHGQFNREEVSIA
jgi:hypothetical protein